VTLMGSNGASVVVLPWGGRVLGAFVPNARANALWVNEAIFDRAGFTGRPKWKNIGGERTWLGPERELFIRDLKRVFETYCVPEALGPGAYRVVQSTSGSVTLVQEAKLVSHLTGHRSGVRIQKEISLLDLPASFPDALCYRQSVSLDFLENPGPLRIGLWNLSQLPAGGTILVGTESPARWTRYFGQDKQGRVRSDASRLDFKLTATEADKIGVQREGLTGWIGYIRPDNTGTWTLSLRNIQLGKPADYIDTPWDKPDDTGYAVQCYNDDGQYGSFGELEYHSPAVGGPGRPTESRDVSTVTVVSGTRPKVERVGLEMANLPV